MTTLLQKLFPAALLLMLTAAAGAQSARTSEPDEETLIRGKYLATAADCVACHTLPGQLPFSGGNVFKTPFGTIYSPNITPDVETGIGSWSDRDFLRALHQGMGKDGEHLYPAFPYTQFTRISDVDALAIKAYLFSLPAVKRTNTPNAMKFPYNIRSLMWVWNLLNFNEGRFTPDPARSAAYNRGHYLAEALGHCNECHTPRNQLLGLSQRRHLSGGVVDGWEAFNITPDAVSGIGDWTNDDIVTYLSTGHLKGRASASGPMADVVSFSLRFLTPEDLQAIALYLKDQPPVRDNGVIKSRHAYGNVDEDRLSFSAADVDRPDGRALYVAACASCHALSGTGLPAAVPHNSYPSLIGSSVLGANTADNLVLTLLHGVQRATTDGTVYMPPFGPDSVISNAMNDEQIASLSNYLMTHFGNPQATQVTADRVSQLRLGSVTDSDLTVLLVGGALAAAAIVILVTIYLLRRRRLH